MNQTNFLKLLLLFGVLNTVKAQDTIIFTNQTRLICRVTQIYANKVEYLKLDDTVQKQYYTYPRIEILEICFANGKRIQIAEASFSSPADTTKRDEQLYRQGFEEGYKYYEPKTEQIVGVSVILVPFISLPGCLYYSFKKVTERDNLGYRYDQNKDTVYRLGYLDGASKRRRVAAWSSFGASLGVGAAIGLLYSAGNGQ